MSDIPFIKLVKTPFAKYAYDVNRNQMILLNDEIYDYFSSSCKTEISDASKEKISKLKQDGFLSSYHISKIQHPELDNAEYQVDRNMRQITLQVTQSCNFRCAYCPYTTAEFDNQRSHGAKQMSFEVAKKSIDFFAEHSKEQNDVAIGFYGGEPLLRFDLIKQIVDYSEKVFMGKGILFTLTTNGSLLNEEIVEFLEEHEFNLMISLDGPPEIHNKSRKFASTGKGTFETIENNLRKINETHSDFLKKCSVNVVVDPRYSANAIHNMYSNNKFYEQLNINMTLIDDFFSIEHTVADETYLKESNIHDFKAWMSKIGKYPTEKVSKMSKEHVDHIVQDNYDSVMKPDKRLSSVMAPGGPCIPGQRRLFVTADGDFYPCERVSETSDVMKIGDYINGIDIEKVKNLLNIGQLTEDKCKNCFAVRYCTVCAKNCDNNGKLCAELKASNCANVRSEVIDNFKDYLFIKEFAVKNR